MNSQKPVLLSSFIKQKRMEANLSQADIASALGYNPQFVSNWERGISSPPANVIPKLVQVLKVSQEEILEILTLESMAYWHDVVYGQSRAQRKKRSRVTA